MRTPPRLVARTLAVTFVTVSVILAVIFIALTVEVRDRVRTSETEKLQVSERVFTALETRRQQDELAAVGVLTDNPTLKAALQTYLIEHADAAVEPEQEQQLRNTIQDILENLASATGAEVVSIVSPNGRVFGSAGPGRASWPRDQRVELPPGAEQAFEGVVVLPAGGFRIAAAPMAVGDMMIGALILGTPLDAAYARRMATLAGAGIVITIDGKVVARTVSDDVASAAIAASSDGGMMRTIKGEEYAIRPLFTSGRAQIFSTSSIDAAAAAATRDAMVTLGMIAFGALILGGLASLWLARSLTEPINRVAGTISTMTAAREFGRTLEPTGSSRELDALTDAFNQMMRGITAAEAETESAYVGAIRGLAAALDARDPYTAGHSERVSELSVLMARQLALADSEVEIIRLGALLHDIGKIGVSDAVLRKPGSLTSEEFEQIKRHPALGARILRQVPFLAPHLPIVELHHERPDGHGYPFGMRGEDIPVAARIVHVADAFDAMTSARAYRQARDASFAVAELQRCAGTQFDSRCVDALVAALPAFSGIGGHMLRTAIAIVAILCAAPVFAQESRVLPVAVDTAAAIDHSVDETGLHTTNVVFDAVASARIAPHLEVVTRPFLQRLGSTGEWNWQVWVAEVRYERPGRVGVRVDAGLIPSPVGYANLMLRPQANPTISLPSSLFQPLPTIQPGGPRMTLLGAVYAYGANVTVSGAHWDARAAVIDTSPLRIRRIFAADFNNPPRFGNVVLGGGFTPFVGVRIGAAVTHGGWQKAGESPTITADRNLTMVNIESEVEFRHTKLGGEWTHTALQTSIGDARSQGWFVQGRQALSPRWFAAGRVERITSPFLTSSTTRADQHFTGFEEVLGFRLTRELTIRGGHRARETFGRDGYTHAAEVSLVWWRRWL